MVHDFDFCAASIVAIPFRTLKDGSRFVKPFLLRSLARPPELASHGIFIKLPLSPDPTRTAHDLPLRSEPCSSAHAGRRYARRASNALSEMRFARNSSRLHRRPDRSPALPT